MTKINIFLFKTQRNNKIKLVKQVLSREDKLIYAINPAYKVYLFQIRIKKKNVSVYEVIKHYFQQNIYVRFYKDYKEYFLKIRI